MNDREASAYRRAATDIVLRTGPHLGGFNDRISLPEVIEAVAAMAATCIAEKFLKLRDQKRRPKEDN